MLPLILACVIAGCCAMVLVDSRQSSHPPGPGAISAAGRLDAVCARLNRLLLTAAVVLAVLVAVLSSGRDSRWEAKLAAHPEWFGPSFDPESSIGFAPANLGPVAAQCQTWIYTCHCMRNLPRAPAVSVRTNCVPAGE
ncbi:MAG TPA: hypothetical protein VMF86_15745 [Stellaceae bacterium]|nr:hypothetical protein [Stellaceae bacterium]